MEGYDTMNGGDEMEARIMKMEEERMQVFGWASVAAAADGQVIEDYQQDILTSEELERAAYTYVLAFGDAGCGHSPALRKKGKLIESVVFTEEKQEAIGIPPGIVPIGWWVGFQILDEEVWERIRMGEYRMFSIEGMGERAGLSGDGDIVEKADRMPPIKGYRGYLAEK